MPFKKGVSGNLKGRPKGKMKKPLKPLLEKLLEKSLPVIEKDLMASGPEQRMGLFTDLTRIVLTIKT